MKNISLTLAFLTLAALAPGGSAAELDAAASIPVFSHGRVKPLQTFSRDAADAVYDRSSKVSLSLKGYFDVKDRDDWGRRKEEFKNDEWSYIVAEQLAKDPQYAGLLDLFPAGKARTFDPTEIVLSWLIEPQKWEQVPFIYAPHEDLRKVLGVKTDYGLLKYVSPRDVMQSESLRAYLVDLRDRQDAVSEGEEFQATDTDKLVQELLDRYNGWRALAFDPRQPLTLSQIAESGTRGRFVKQVTSAIQLANRANDQGESWAGRLESLASVFKDDPEAPLVREIIAVLTSMDELRGIAQKLVQQFGGSLEGGDVAGIPLEEARAAVIRFRDSSKLLAEKLESQKTRIFEDQGGLSGTQRGNYGKMFRELAAKAKDLHRMSLDMHAALYDEGGSLLVTPAMNPYALAKHRDTENTSQPWLSLQAILYSDDLAADFPRQRISAVRSAWADLESAFAHRHEDGQSESFVKAQAGFADALRQLGESAEPRGRKAVEATLPGGEQDEVLLAYTAYPPQWKIDTEVRYNETDPFKWSWVLSLMALVCFSLAFGAARKPLFWTGVALLLTCAVWTGYGFSMRILVTGWAPVTNMYETVVYVPWVMLMLGLWFLLLPLTWTGISNAWRATAIPGTWEASPVDAGQFAWLGPKGWTALNWLMQPFRFSLMAALFAFMSVMKLAHGGRSYFPLLPNLSDVEGATGMAGSLGVWFVGLVCLLLTVWFGPRFILTGVLSPIFVPLSWLQRGALGQMAKEVYPRKMFAGAAAFGSWFFLFLAWYSPVLDESFQPLQPVLRSNFWLTIHVLTIVASYGAGMLAWGLGLIGLFHLMFGKYRDPVVPAHLPDGLKPADHADHKAAPRRPPEAVGVLANYAYRAIQVAVLLLAAGTILGGLWADVSWGRFWGWDPKEVWALISLLVYLAILHGRFAGWFNHFGLIFGTVFGATMIAMSWYGVNFVLPTLAKGGEVGLHSYGEGAGGQGYVYALVGLNWVLLGVATVRYFTETSIARQPLDMELAVPAELSPKPAS